MGFKLGQAKRKMITPNNHVPVYKRNLDKGILGEAYKDGSIAVDTSVKEGSQQYKDVVAHEMDHAKRMKTGELDYGTDFVRWRGKTYPRKDGKIKYKGSWMIEGHRDFPWEKIADKAMDKPRPPNKSALAYHDDISKERNPDGWAKSHRADGTARSGKEIALINDALALGDITLPQAIAAAEYRIEAIKKEEKEQKKD